MSSSLAAEAELGKLARVLGVDATGLPSLEGCDPADVRALRRQVADTLLEADRRQFARVAGLGMIAPVGLVARLAERALGPVLVARAAGLADPSLACEIAQRVSADFLADIAVELDPRHAREAIAGLPGERIAAAAAVLEVRGELAAMGVFVGHLSEEALSATLGRLSTDALLRVGFLIEAPERLDEIVAQLPDERVVALVTLAEEEDRREELLGIASHLGDEQRRRLAGSSTRLGAADPGAALVADQR
jgi:hypothetical protein